MVLAKSVGALSHEQDRAVSFSTWVGERLTTVSYPEVSAVTSKPCVPSPSPSPPSYSGASSLSHDLSSPMTIPSFAPTPTSISTPAIQFQREYLQASELARSRGDLDFLRVRLFGTNYTALFDNGASACFIDSALVDKCGLRTVPVPTMHVALGDESTVPIDQAVFAELRFAQGLRYNAKLLVMNLGPAPIILGQTFIKDLEVVVDHGPARTVTCPATANRPAVVLPILPPPTDRAPSVNLTCLTERHMTRELRRASRTGQPTTLAHIRLRVRRRFLSM